MHIHQPENLPARLECLRKRLSRMANAEIEWTPDDTSDGKMSTEWHDGRPIIFFKEYSNCGAAMALANIELDIRGFPCPVVDPCLRHAEDLANLLHNLLRNAVVIPLVQALGFDPLGDESDSVRRWQVQLAAANDARIGDEDPAVWNALLALHIARAKRCRCETGAGVDLTPFDCDDRYGHARVLADHLDHAIQLDQFSTGGQYRLALRRCVQILGLESAVTLHDPRRAVVHVQEDET